MEFGEAIQTGFSKYVNFSNRACGSEHCIAVAVRQLHDLDRTGWWLLLAERDRAAICATERLEASGILSRGSHERIVRVPPDSKKLLR